MAGADVCEDDSAMPNHKFLFSATCIWMANLPGSAVTNPTAVRLMAQGRR